MSALEIISCSSGSGWLYSKRIFFFPKKLASYDLGGFSYSRWLVDRHEDTFEHAIQHSSVLTLQLETSLLFCWQVFDIATASVPARTFTGLLHQPLSVSFIKYLVMNSMSLCSIIILSMLLILNSFWVVIGSIYVRRTFCKLTKWLYLISFLICTVEWGRQPFLQWLLSHKEILLL